MNQKLINNATKLAKEVRIAELEMFGDLGFGHIGGALSITDLLAVLYAGEMKIDPKNPKWENRDRLVISKGHAGPAAYAVLALKGFFPKEMLFTLNRGGTDLPSHCDKNHTPGIDMTTGSLGQGISTAAGIASGLDIKGIDRNTYCIIGDGESQEGQVWEAATYLASKQLENFILFLDNNKKQIDGNVKDVNSLGDLKMRFTGIGWNVDEIDGNNIEELVNSIDNAKARKNGKPNVIIMNTIKGAGVSFIENMTSNHHITITKEQAEAGIEELRGE